VNRRKARFLAAASAVPVVAALLASGPGWAGSSDSSRPDPQRGSAPSRPNVVFVLTDDFSWDLVRHMPRVRAMQRRGVTFSNYFVTNSLCCPSRASIFTGAFPHNTGIYSNAGEDGGFVGFRRHGLEQETFATALKAEGYRTALMGKYLNSYRPESDYVPPVWTKWAASDRAYSEFDYTLNQDGVATRYGRGRREYMTDVLARKGAEFVADSAEDGKPFFLELSTFAPHKPYTPAPRHARLFPRLKAPRGPAFDFENVDAPSWLWRRPRRPAEISRMDSIFRDRVRSVQAVDELVGRIRAMLRAYGLEDNTYIVFSSDNGYHLGEHRLMPGKMTAFDSDINVPLIVTGPGVPAGRTIERIAQSIDLNATFTELAGTQPSALSDGRSLVPLLHGKRVSRWRRAALVEHRGLDMTPDDPDFQGVQGLGTTDAPPTYEAIRTPYALYVEYLNGEREFYDLKRDPEQTTNAYWQLSPARLARLESTLNRLRQCRGRASCWAAATEG
jgi:N-acetylglucosamine-6-sulfatase